MHVCMVVLPSLWMLDVHMADVLSYIDEAITHSSLCHTQGRQVVRELADKVGELVSGGALVGG